MAIAYLFVSLRNCRTVLRCDCTIAHPRQRWRRDPVSPPLPQHMVVALLVLIVATPVIAQGCLIVPLVCFSLTALNIFMYLFAICRPTSLK